MRYFLSEPTQASEYYSHLNKDNVLDELATNASLQEDLRQWLKNDLGVTAETPEEIKSAILSHGRFRDGNMTYMIGDAINSPKNVHARRMENLQQRIFDSLPNAYEEGGDGVGQAVVDYGKGILTDPINVIAGLASVPAAGIKAVAGTVGAKALKEVAENVGEKFLGGALSKDAATEAATALAKMGEQGLGTQLGREAMWEAAKYAGKRDAAIEGTIGGVAGYADQERLVDIGIQDEVSPIGVVATAGLGAGLGGAIGAGMGAVAGRNAIRELGQNVGAETAAELAARATYGQMPTDAGPPNPLPVQEAFRQVPGAAEKMPAAMQRQAEGVAPDDTASHEKRLADEAEARKAEFENSLPRLTDEEAAKANSIIDSLEQIQLQMADETPAIVRLKTYISDNDATVLQSEIRKLMTPQNARQRALARQRIDEYDNAVDVDFTEAQTKAIDKDRAWLDKQDRLLNIVRSIDEEDLANDEDAFERIAKKLSGYKLKEAEGGADQADLKDLMDRVPPGVVEPTATPSPNATQQIGATEPPSAPTPDATPTANEAAPNANQAAPEPTAAPVFENTDDNQRFLDTLTKLESGKGKRFTLEKIAAMTGATPEQAQPIADALVAQGKLKKTAKGYVKAKPEEAAVAAPVQPAATNEPTATTPDATTESIIKEIEAQNEQIEAALVDLDAKREAAMELAVTTAKQHIEAVAAKWREAGVIVADGPDDGGIQLSGYAIGAKDFLEAAAQAAANEGRTVREVLIDGARLTAQATIDYINDLSLAGYDKTLFMHAVDLIEVDDVFKRMIIDAYGNRVMVNFQDAMKQAITRFNRTPEGMDDLIRFMDSMGPEAASILRGNVFEFGAKLDEATRKLVDADEKASKLIKSKVAAFVKSLEPMKLAPEMRDRMMTVYKNALYENYVTDLKTKAQQFAEKHVAKLEMPDAEKKKLSTKVQKALVETNDKALDRLLADDQVRKIVEIARQTEFTSKVLTIRSNEAAAAAKDGSNAAFKDAMNKVAKALKTIGLVQKGRWVGPAKTGEVAPSGKTYSVKKGDKSYEVTAGKEYTLTSEGKGGLIKVGGSDVGSYEITATGVKLTIGDNTEQISQARLEEIIAKRLVKNGIISKQPAKIAAEDGTAIPTPLAESTAEVIEKAVADASSFDAFADLTPAVMKANGLVPDGMKVAIHAKDAAGKNIIRVPKDGQTLAQVAGKTKGFTVGLIPEGATKVKDQLAGFKRIAEPKEKIVAAENAAVPTYASVEEQLLDAAKRRALTMDEAHRVMVEDAGMSAAELFNRLVTNDQGFDYDPSMTPKVSVLPAETGPAFFNEQIEMERVFAEYLPHGIVMPVADRLHAIRRVSEIFDGHDQETIIGMRNLIARLAGDKAPLVDDGSSLGNDVGGRFDPNTNKVILKQNPNGNAPDLFVATHEFGHWAWRNILSAEDRIEFLTFLRDNAYDDAGNIKPEFRNQYDLNKVSGTGVVGNQFSNPNELFANFFALHATAGENAIVPQAAYQNILERIAKKIMDAVEFIAQYLGAFATSYDRKMPVTVPEELADLFNNILLPTSYERRFGDIVDASGKKVEVSAVAGPMLRLQDLDKARYALERDAIHGAWTADPTEMAKSIKDATWQVWQAIYGKGGKWVELSKEFRSAYGTDKARALGNLLDKDNASSIIEQMKQYVIHEVDATDEVMAVVDRQAADEFESINQIIDMLDVVPANKKGKLLGILLDSDIADPEQAMIRDQEIAALAKQEGVSYEQMVDKILDDLDSYDPDVADSAIIAADTQLDQTRMAFNGLAMELSNAIRLMQDLIAEKFIEGHSAFPNGASIERFDSINRHRVSGFGSVSRAAYLSRRDAELKIVRGKQTQELIDSYKNASKGRKEKIVQVLRERSMERGDTGSLPDGKTFDDAPKDILKAIETGNFKSLSNIFKKALNDGDGERAQFAAAAYARMRMASGSEDTAIEKVSTPKVAQAAKEVEEELVPVTAQSLAEKVNHRNPLSDVAGKDVAARLLAMMRNGPSDSFITNEQMGRMLGQDIGTLDPDVQVAESGDLYKLFVNKMRLVGHALANGKNANEIVPTLAEMVARLMNTDDGFDATKFAKHFTQMLKDQSNLKSKKLKPVAQYFPDMDKAAAEKLAAEVKDAVAMLTEHSAFDPKAKKELGVTTKVTAKPKKKKPTEVEGGVSGAAPASGMQSLYGNLPAKVKANISKFIGKDFMPEDVLFVRLVNRADDNAIGFNDGEFGQMAYFTDAKDGRFAVEPGGEITPEMESLIRTEIEIANAVREGDDVQVTILMHKRDAEITALGMKPEDYDFTPVVLAKGKSVEKMYDLDAPFDATALKAFPELAYAAAGAKTNGEALAAVSEAIGGNEAMVEVMKARGFVGLKRGNKPVAVFDTDAVKSVFDDSFASMTRNARQITFGFDLPVAASIPAGKPIKVNDDFSAWVGRLDLAGADPQDVSWFRKVFKKRDLEAKDIDDRVKWGKFFNLKTVAENLRKINANWIADFTQPPGGAGYFEKQAADFSKNISRVFDSLDALPGSRTGIRKWADGIKFWGEVPQSDSEKKIVRALRRGDPRGLSEEETRAFTVISREFTAELNRLRDAGIPIGDVTTYQGVKGYFPQVWDVEKLRKDFDKAADAFKEYFIAENRRQIAEFSTKVVDVLSPEEALDRARKLVLKLTEDRGGLVSPDGRGTYRDVMADQFFHRKIVPTVDDLNKIGLEDFLVDNLRAITATYFDSSSRRRMFHQKFGDRSHGLYDYLEVAQGGQAAVTGLLLNRRERSSKFISPGAEEELKYTTIHPVTKNPEEAMKIAEQVIGMVQKGNAAGRDEAKAYLMGLAKGNEMNLKHWERRADAIVNALYDHGGEGNAFTGQDMKQIMGSFRAWQRKPIDSGTFSDAARVVSKNLRNVNAVTRLGFATLSSFTDIIYPAVRSGNLGASVKAWQKYLGQEEAYRKAARNIGVGIESLLHEYLSDIHGVESSRFTNAFFNANLMTPWTRLNREVAALTAYEAFKSEQAVAQKYRASGQMHHQRYQTAVRFLRRYGLAEYAQEGARTLESIVDDQANDQIRIAVMKFANESIFAPNPNDIPLWAQTPWGSLAFQFKSFPMMMGRLAGYTIQEAKQGNVKPLLYLLSLAPAFGAASQGIKDLIQMRGAEDETSPSARDAFSLRERALSKIAEDLGVPIDGGKWDEQLGWYVEGLLGAGGFGLLADMFWQGANSLDNGSFGEQRIASLILGPTYGLGQDVIKIASGTTEGVKNVLREQFGDGAEESNYRQRQAGRSFVGMIPLVGGNRVAREWGAEFAGGEAANPYKPD